MTPRHRFLAALALMLGGAGASATAQEPAVPAAIGRISEGGPTGHHGCSGVLVAPDLVLTAAHCAAAFAGSDRIGDLGFLAGFVRGQAVAEGRAVAVILDPGHAPGPLTAASVPQDVAVIRLAAPLGEVTPLPLSVLPAPPARLSVVGYLNAQPEAPVRRGDCPFRLSLPPLIVLGCPVESGLSGAPVLRDGPEGPAVVGVVSARAGPALALAAPLPDWVRALVAAAD